MNRRFGNWPEVGRYYRPRAGVYAVIAAGDGILVTFQEKPYAELQLPGGGIDPGESTLRALHREVLEETGFRITHARRLGMCHRYTFMPDYNIWAQKQCHIYLAAIATKQAEPTEPDHTAVFLSWDVAEQQLGVAGDRHFLGVARQLLRV